MGNRKNQIKQEQDPGAAGLGSVAPGVEVVRSKKQPCQ